MSRYRTALSEARGLGSAHHGSGHWLAQRLSAIALIPLLLWFCFSLLYTVFTADYAGAVAWISQPWIMLALILLVGTVFYHSALGLQVIVEDYVHTRWKKAATLIVLRLFNFLLAIAGILAVLRIALGG
ncbi:MAG TPA: succinate dehydrogenase, hydrophobic membrane anchor protein [Gammaproteobacteria bacterium]|nr:succinate dehydrogenase, hydrophobic membrane anchor protein [Gammaproteobacteria bacterium]